MNDKAKKILSYVACAIGGACLGIGLLGGLSYCSTSSAREKADTINTIDRVRHNEKTTTTNGGYDKYTFSIDNWANGQNRNTYDYRVFNVDYSTYTLSLARSSVGNAMSTGYYSIGSVINSVYDANFPSTAGTLNFLVIEGYTTINVSENWKWYWYYFSFMGFQNPMEQMPFYLLSDIFTQMLSLSSWSNPADWNASRIVLNTDKTDYFLITDNTAPEANYRYRFQDMVSSLKEEGYNDGYNAGYADGETAGNSAGYSSGYEAGSSAGYESGYTQGFQEGYMNTYYAFTSLIVNRNAIWNMADIPWHSNNDIYVESGHLNDYPFLDPSRLQTNTYVNWAYLALFRDTATLIPYWIYAQRYTTSQNNGYVSFVIRISPADQTSTENAGNIGSYSGGVSLSATSIFQTETVTEWTAPNRCQLIAFGSEDPRDIYRDWFDNGYILPRGIAVDENAYEQGYKQGQLDAQRNTSMNNVFALFTPAFGAVASFFDMKIFGFLPLYWFLIAPLFIALISLIMRMVKH